jgi:hypothetical protein
VRETSCSSLLLSFLFYQNDCGGSASLGTSPMASSVCHELVGHWYTLL